MPGSLIKVREVPVCVCVRACVRKMKTEHQSLLLLSLVSVIDRIKADSLVTAGVFAFRSVKPTQRTPFVWNLPLGLFLVAGCGLDVSPECVCVCLRSTAVDCISRYPSVQIGIRLEKKTPITERP